MILVDVVVTEVMMMMNGGATNCYLKFSAESMNVLFAVHYYYYYDYQYYHQYYYYY